MDRKQLHLNLTIFITCLEMALRERKIILNPEDTKNTEPRIVYMNHEVYQMVLFQKNLRDAKYPNCPYMFFRDGQRIKGFRKAWVRACEKAGLEGKLFHDLRRTAVRNMVRAGISEKVAMNISGHRTRSTFARYNILNEDDLRRAARKVSEYHEKVMGTISGTIQKSPEIQPPVTR